ncbi:MAG: hypothetical protein E6K94_11595 [Thaumarchaeota archaeon]|nr:MAG: hypothetical protein E6K94_11595 [Nitrososphaerota archaeon]
MTIELTLQKEIEESKRSLDGPIDDTTYRRDLKKRIELLDWVLDNMKNPDIQICDLIESKMNVVTMTINQTHTIFESDKLHSELNILHWIFYVVCKAQFKGL